MAQQRLADAHLTGGLALGDALFLPQQAQCAGKISSHSVHPTLVFYIQEVNYIALYTKSKSLFAPSGRNSARMGGRGRLFYSICAVKIDRKRQIALDGLPKSGYHYSVTNL